MLGVVALVTAVILVGMACRVVPEARRLVVVRAGRPARVAGPGLVWVIPVLERGVAVNLDEAVPEWRALDPETLARLVEATLTRKP